MDQPALDKNKLNGYVILYAVIVVGAAILAMSIYFSWLASFSLKNFSEIKKSKQAQYLADTCAEMALLNIFNDNNFSGSGNFSGYGGNCTYQILNLGTLNREIRAEGFFSNTFRKVKIVTNSFNPKINVVFWKEVADF